MADNQVYLGISDGFRTRFLIISQYQRLWVAMTPVAGPSTAIIKLLGEAVRVPASKLRSQRKWASVLKKVYR